MSKPEKVQIICKPTPTSESDSTRRQGFYKGLEDDVAQIIENERISRNEKSEAETTQVEDKPLQTLPAHKTEHEALKEYCKMVVPGSLKSRNSAVDTRDTSEVIRRSCGCIRTSEKLKNILKMFPQVPPPTPIPTYNDLSPLSDVKDSKCECRHQHRCHCTNLSSVYVKGLTSVNDTFNAEIEPHEKEDPEKRFNKTWMIISELVSLLQLTVTATALVIYYIIYCYMQLIYYTLRSAMYFHQADPPMKLTITLVTVSGIALGIHIISRLEQLIGIHIGRY